MSPTCDDSARYWSRGHYAGRCLIAKHAIGVRQRYIDRYLLPSTWARNRSRRATFLIFPLAVRGNSATT